MKAFAFALATLILLVQYPLWLGRGGWFRVSSLEGQLRAQKEANVGFQRRNSALDAEVRDLKQGMEAIEERARYEFGMIKPDEVFFRIVPATPPAEGER